MRRDVFVSNESSGLVITSRAMDADEAGPLEQAAWKKAVAAGKLVPVELRQDDSVLVRVVVDEPLTEVEAEEWVGKLTAKLLVKGGELVLCGGIGFLEDGGEAEAEHVVGLEVEDGTYHADLYAHLPGVNGPLCVDEEPAAYWKRTRGRKKPPAWITESLELDEGAPIGFLLHLTPLGARKKVAAATLGPDGWFSVEAWERRAPGKCPAGLASSDVLRAAPRGAGEAVEVELPDLEGLLAGCEPKKIGNGPVELPLGDLDVLFTLAWFATDSSNPEVRVELPAGKAPPALDGLEHTQVVRDGQRLRLGGLVGGARWGAFHLVREAARALKDLPDRSTVELLSACPPLFEDDDDGDDEGDAGKQRYRGTVKKGVLRLDLAYPAVNAALLREALALAREAREGKALTMRSAREAEELRTKVMASSDGCLFTGKSALVADGAALRLAQPDDAFLTIAAAYVFRARWSTVWPVAAEEEDEDGPDALEQLAATITKAIAAPSSAEVIHEGTFSQYRRADLFALKGVDRAKVEATDRRLAKLGFVHIGDLVCVKAGDVVVRGYAAPEGGDAWAVLMQGTFGQGGFDFASETEGGASVTTSTTPGQSDDPRKKTFKRSYPPGTPFDELWREHRERLALVEKEHGRTVPVKPDLAALCAAIDAALVKQLGG